MVAETARKFEALEAQAQKIMQVFIKAGHEAVSPAILQPAGVFLDVIGESLRARTYVFTDPDGDETLPASRPHRTDVPAAHRAQWRCALQSPLLLQRHCFPASSPLAPAAPTRANSARPASKTSVFPSASAWTPRRWRPSSMPCAPLGSKISNSASEISASFALSSRRSTCPIAGASS